MKKEEASEADSSGVGSYLAELRQSRGYSLRQVEEKTKRAVSNAYLSQLEHGKVKQPSPNVLYSLATAYDVEYDTLMSKAGYASFSSRDITSHEHTTSPSPFGDLTEEEERELSSYLEFLRSKSRKK